jgi:hypothetical protein
MNFDNLVNSILGEEVSREDRIKALTSLGNIKHYKVLDITNSRGVDFLVSVKDIEALSLEEATDKTMQLEIDKITADLQDDPAYLERYLRDWVFSKVSEESDIGYVNTGEESGYVIIGQSSSYWSPDDIDYKHKVSAISSFINTKFF